MTRVPTRVPARTPVRAPWWRPRTLRRRLVFGVTSLVTVVLLAVGVLSVYSLHSYVSAMSDAELDRSLDALGHSYDRLEIKRGDPAHPIDAGEDGLTAFGGQAPGNLIAVLHKGVVVQSAVFPDGEPKPVQPDVVKAVSGQQWTNLGPRTVKLPRLGWYRMAGQDAGGGDVLVSGVSMEDANSVVARKTVAVAVMTLLAIALTAVGTIAVVNYALRPLSRVASTAAKVATRQFGSEDHRITERVRPEDTDPRTEVGIVGDTLNKLLDNVDSALAELAASHRRTRQFLTDASHELRTPLAAIRGYAELTRQDSAALPETTEYALARIESEAQRMSGLVEDLLLISRLEEHQDLETDDVELCDLVINAVNDAAVSSPAHRWRSRLPDVPIWVRGDPARLHQVIGNLLANARVHTPAGVSVTTSLTPGPGYVELTVADDGPGIPEELLPNLFDRFVVADKSRSRALGSTGLGLAIVSTIVKAHGGRVKVKSNTAGTIFRVRLPMLKEVGEYVTMSESYNPHASESTV
ncbi:MULTISPECIES: sensor histidine kinase [Mycobacteriaceae]|uniref:sensor histidine kinase n=1 Tax=Mycobacteriaceae TaxID=1762 RepID=UPI001CFC3FCA|nr:HAMP domain-containing sensor histidine kinase [Mycolicibacterium phocaicum]UCZ63610.1 HAMP domain-containing histidine kinase [Mycolicibacterium phocaicum]